MAATEQAFINQPGPKEKQIETHSHSSEGDGSVDEIEKKALWLKTKLKEGPIDGPLSLKTYREDIRQILFQEFNSPISDLEIGVVVRKAFPKHSRKGKYYLGIGACNAKYADEAGRTITTDDPKSLMTVQSDGESRESSPVMLKPVKKRAIQAWKETENGQAFAADQMIRDANNQASAPVVSIAASDGLVRPPWPPMLVRLPQHVPMPPRGVLFPSGRLPGSIHIPHPVLATSEPNNNINRSLAPSRGRKRGNVEVAAFQKMSYGAERPGKKQRKEGAMIELSSSHNGLIAERTNLAAMHIQPIILDFEVPPPKLPLMSPVSTGVPSDQRPSDEKEPSRSGELPVAAQGVLDKVPASPHAAESAEVRRLTCEELGKTSSSLSSSDGNSGGSTKVTEEQRAQSRKSKDPFKKPDIDNYRTNVSAGRCLMCQNPIPPNGSKDASPQESAILSICMKCKKVAMSGSKSFKPVPKFPFACNPKLAPRTVYVPPPQRLFRPRPPAPSGPQKAVGIRLYPPMSRSKSVSSQRSSGTPVQSPSASPRSPSQMSMPGSPAPSLPLGSPQPCSPALIMHSAPPSPRHESDAGMKIKSMSLPPSPSMIPQHHPSSPAGMESREPDPARRLLPGASLQVPSPSYSSNPSTPGGRDSSSSERLSLPPGREQDDATIKALLQLGRGVERAPSEHSAESTPVPSPMSRLTDKETVAPPHPTGSISIPHSPISLPQVAMSGSLPLLAGQVPVIPPNAGVVMGPEGQLLPIVPSWPPLGVPTSEALSIISQGGYPPMPILIQRPPSPTVSSATSDPVISGIRSRSLLDPAKTSIAGPSSESHPYDISQPKYRKGLKRFRVSEGLTGSPADRSYRADTVHEDKSKSKQSIVIVGTNCAGSSSVKLNNDSKEPSYHQEEVVREAPEMYGKLFSAFCCRCSGREIMLFQCTDCDFVCNNKYGMELHIAAQRHAESRNKSSMPEVLTRHANEADDRDEIASQSSVETQSADTDTDAASPPPTRVPREWSRVTEASSQLPHTPWHDHVLPFIPGRSGPPDTSSSRAPSLSSQASFVTASTYGSFGTVTENTVPLDLSGRTFQPAPYIPGVSSSSFQMKEQRKEGSVEEPSPLDLSGYSRSPIMSTVGGAGGMQQFLSNRKLGTQGSVTAKRIPLDLPSNQQPSPIPDFVLTTTSSKKAAPPPAPQTFFDLMRLHNIPIPSTANISTLNPSKSLQSPSPYTKFPAMRPLTGPATLSVSRAHRENPSSPKSYPSIPSIVLSSSTSTSPSVPKSSPYPTTELTRPPPGIIASPIVTQPQSLNYQGGTISIRPTMSVSQHVSSKTVPVLSPFPDPVPVLASASESRGSPGRESSNMESLNVNVASPCFNLGFPVRRGSPTVQESPKGRQRYGALESPGEYPSRKDHLPVMSPQPVYIKIEPPDLSQDEEYNEKELEEQEQQWRQEAEKQARILEASLTTGTHSPTRSRGLVSGRSGIGRTSWGISSKSLQIRDSVYVNTTANLSASVQTNPDGSLPRTSLGQDSHHGARMSSGVQRTNTFARESLRSPSSSPTDEGHPDISRETSQTAEGNVSLDQCGCSNNSLPSTPRKDGDLSSTDGRDNNVEQPTEPVSPTVLHIKVEK